MTAELGEGEVVRLLDWVGLTSGIDESRQDFSTPRQTGQAQSEKSGHRPVAGVKAERRAGSTSLRKSKTGVKR
jgi:hypothetical protein